jgi:hypothetical protein
VKTLILSVYLLGSIVLFNQSARSESVGALIQKDYEHLYSMPEGDEHQFRVIELPITDHGELKVKLVSEESTCGAHQCDYAGYMIGNGDRFDRVIDFQGSYEQGPLLPNGTHALLIHSSSHEPGDDRVCEWRYDLLSRKFIELKSSCAARGPSSIKKKKKK